MTTQLDSDTEISGQIGKNWSQFAQLLPLVFIVTAFLFFGGRSLWDTSEARYAEVAFEMLHTHNWLTPTLAGEAHLTKPPLSYWLIALGMKIFGVNPWGARFFLSCAFLATILTVQRLGKTMQLGSHQSLAAALIYATSAIPFAAGHTLTTDAFLVLWETLGVLAAWEVWQGNGPAQSRWRLVFWMAFALAFLTKGPPGCLPFLVIAAFLLLRPDRERNRLFSISGLMLFLIVAFSWYGYIVWTQPDLLGYFFKDEFINRIFTTEHHRNAPFWIYFPIILAGVGPWLLLWPWFVQTCWQHRPGSPKKLCDAHIFCLLWILIPLLIFIIAQSRLIFYVLPLFVPVSLALGSTLIDKGIPYLFNPISQRKRHVTVSVIAALWITAMTIYTGGMDFFTSKRSLQEAATIFQETLTHKQLETSQLYWIWAERQRYSLAFYMQRIIRNTDTLLHAATLSKQPIYLTKEQSFSSAVQEGRFNPFGSPRTLAYAQGYVLFTLTPDATTQNTSNGGR